MAEEIKSTPPPAPLPPLRSLQGGRKTVEVWRDEKQTPMWLWNGARCGNLWPEGQMMTEADYDAAIDAAGKAVTR
jgi:hypothetical protein